MKLSRLKLHGFKSFADSTELRFHDGLTAIVGPNGCGKSNISDAIRWVLGEQRASAIRGSKMEEAIFQGTAERRPVHRAEVSLVASNEDGLLPVSFQEVEIRRTVFREGGSDYEMNGASCRLRDILDICRDTGLGANAYAIIEQGMVDAILSERTDDRRQVFEEAAGIGLYKDRRRAARRRLDSAEADLARLEDVIGEVETKVRSLARQKGRARRFDKLRRRRLSLDLAVTARQLDDAAAEVDALTERLDTLGRDEPASRAALQAAEAKIERRRLEAAELSQDRGTIASRLQSINANIAERERRLAVGEERREHAERRLIQIADERERLDARIRGYEAETSEHSERRKKAGEELKLWQRKVLQTTERRDAARAALSTAREEEESARAREEELSSRLARLDARAAGADERAAELKRRMDRLDGERADLEAERARLDEQGDLFADRVRELAAETAELEGLLDEASRERDRLRRALEDTRNARGRAEADAARAEARLAALEAVEPGADLPSAVAALLERTKRSDGVHPLAEVLELPAQRAAAFEHTLGALLRLLIVDDEAAAARIRNAFDEQSEETAVALLARDRLPRLRSFLDAVEFAGQPPSEPVLLGRRERLARLRAELDAATRLVEERADASARMEERLKAAEEELNELGDRARERRRLAQEADAEEAGRSGQRSRIQRELEESGKRLRAAEDEMESARKEAAAARAERQKYAAERDERSQARVQAGDARAKRESEWDAIREDAASVQVEHARAESALAELDGRIEAGRRGVEEGRSRAAALEEEEQEHRSTLEKVDDAREEMSERLQGLFGDRDTVTGELEDLEERLSIMEAEIGELDSDARSLRKGAEEQGEERHQIELRRAEADSRRQRIRERLEAEWSRPFEELVDEAEPLEFEQDDPEALAKELGDVVESIQRLGAVNMLALEQHEEEKKRLDFLYGQREDLVAARDDLRTAIRRINREASQRFMETFEAVRTHFARTFDILFPGGECDIRLADDEDALESPIEISASPGGKRTRRIDLLSGGERALTSLALLFAIYLVKPSPFCVLDEVDAPLDEANIDRLLELLEEFKDQTQFIIITHNPRTIEAADWIYGVTMEQPGVSSIVGVELDEVLATAGAAT